MQFRPRQGHSARDVVGRFAKLRMPQKFFLRRCPVFRQKDPIYIEGKNGAGEHNGNERVRAPLPRPGHLAIHGARINNSRRRGLRNRASRPDGDAFAGCSVAVTRLLREQQWWFDSNILHFPWACSSVVEHLAVNQRVRGSNPSVPAFADMMELVDNADLKSAARWTGV